MDLESEISILAIAIDMGPKRQVQTPSGTTSIVQDVILINEKFQTITLTMWDNFVDHVCNNISNALNRKPVIIGTHLKVKSYNGLSVSTKRNSTILIDPQFEEVLQLTSWVDNNIDKLNDIVNNKTFCAITVVAPTIEKLVQLNKIEDMLFKV
ncbi:replication protein A 70 kDa DNA-binding subunit D-like [Cannabis sativa]|uniref:replication protein A 70 kDa DNA-binding subunit D-like n=1 Tax=Cannabis sativa TaxID=3483 RepID=UPI0029CA560B|nr:replication protein A 70 kDa DNA-binding subunit D-like [Cannabis sativa]